MVQFCFIHLVNSFITIFETLCYVYYIYKAKEINEGNTVQSMLIYDSLSLRHFRHRYMHSADITLYQCLVSY